MGDDAIVILDELLFVFDGEGFFARVDLDGVMDKCGDGRCIVLGDGRLKLDEEIVNLDVVADGEVDGLVESGGGGGLSGVDSWQKERAGNQNEACKLGAGDHSISVENVKNLYRG